MSTNSLIRLPLAKAITPTINLGRSKEYIIRQGAKDNSYQSFTPSSLSNTSINIQVNPPSRQNVVNTRVYIRAKYQATITGVAGAGGKMIVPNLFSARQYPIAQTLNSVEAKINSDSYNQSLNQYWDALARFYNQSDLGMNNYTTTANYLDQYQNYQDFTTFGSARNALGQYGESSDYLRGGFSGFNVISDAAGTAVVELEAVEPLFLQPFNFERAEQEGLVNVNNIQFVFNFAELSTALFSHNSASVGASTINSIVVNIQRFEVLMNFQTLPLGLSIPDNIALPYYDVNPQLTNAGTVNAGQSATIDSSSIQLTSIPKKLFIVVKESQGEKTFANGGLSKTNTYARINNLSLQVGNKQSLLANATIYQLYQLSVKNGLMMSWDQWNKYTGSVFCCGFEDLSLDESEAPGVLRNLQVQARVNFTNLNPSRNINYTLFVIPVYDGIVNNNNGVFSHQTGIINQIDVVDTPINNQLEMPDNAGIYGGFLPSLASIGRLLPSIISGVKSASPLVKQALRAGPQVAKAMEDYLGLGVRSGGEIVNTGGQMMSRSAMRRKM
jgi:hypothetical protein